MKVKLEIYKSLQVESGTSAIENHYAISFIKYNSFIF